MMRNNGVSMIEARTLAQKRNKIRASYYNFYTDKVWGDGASYDLCINSSVLSSQAIAELIVDFAKKKLSR
jgi:cytidylate kinase